MVRIRALFTKFGDAWPMLPPPPDTIRINFNMFINKVLKTGAVCATLKIKPKYFSVNSGEKKKIQRSDFLW